jgi:hypothetical protein
MKVARYPADAGPGIGKKNMAPSRREQQKLAPLPRPQHWKNQPKPVTSNNKSVTYVLSLKCYPFSEPSPSPPITNHQSPITFHLSPLTLFPLREISASLEFAA